MMGIGCTCSFLNPFCFNLSSWRWDSRSILTICANSVFSVLPQQPPLEVGVSFADTCSLSYVISFPS